jgi:ankyrin repeat protein
MAIFERGIGINERDEQGRAPLHCVLDWGHLNEGIRNVAMTLLNRGADVNVQDNHLRTGLHCSLDRICMD